MLTIFLVIPVAVAIGLALNFLFHGKDSAAETDTQRASVRDILGATALLAALLIALVLSAASESYTAARTAAKTEADTIDNLYESAEYVPLPARQAIQAAAVCYSRAVIGPDWEAMAKGEESRVPSNWTGTGPHGLRKTFIEMTTQAPGFGLVVSADQKRGELRSERLVQARPTVPSILSWLMVFLVALSLVGVAYSIPLADKHARSAQFVALGIVTILFCFVLNLIYDFDLPFSGLLSLEPTAMQKSSRKLTGITLQPIILNHPVMVEVSRADAEESASMLH
jgi:cytochrome bd-type quinol oxidase subunit 2